VTVPIPHRRFARIVDTILAPIRACRLAYLPLLMVYFASGAIGLTAVADQFWVKKSLTMTPADLAALAVWLQVPWSCKMVVSALVDSVPVAGSQRHSYVFIGGGLIAAGLGLLAAAAAGWITFASLETIYIVASLLTVVGAVVQEVVADAMSAEVVAREHPEGGPRAQAEIDRDLAMVQVLGRLAYSIGAFVVAWLAGWLAEIMSYAAVFALGLIIPAISVMGGMIVPAEQTERRPIDRRMLGGGALFALVAIGLGVSGLAFAQEILFVVSMGVVLYLMRHMIGELDPDTKARFIAVAIAAFAFRAPPLLGDGYRWFTMDRLGFDERFFGTLQLTGTGIGLVTMWFLVDAATRRSSRSLLLGLTLIAAVLWLPSLMIVNGLHHWTEANLGLGARQIALVDEAAQSPLASLATVPLLTMIAATAPAAQRATWFALAASLMSLAVVASSLITKYLNQIFPVDRGVYEPLVPLVQSVVGIALLLPLVAIAFVWRRLK
jgi:hypothetical protein